MCMHLVKRVNISTIRFNLVFLILFFCYLFTTANHEYASQKGGKVTIYIL